MAEITDDQTVLLEKNTVNKQESYSGEQNSHDRLPCKKQKVQVPPSCRVSTVFRIKTTVLRISGRVLQTLGFVIDG